MNVSVNQDVNNFYFVGQKICHLKRLAFKEYELLLRHRKDTGFPNKKFSLLTCNSNQHAIYFESMVKTICLLLDKHPNTFFSFNLDQQELEYESTFLILSLIPFSKRNYILLEITEVAPMHRNRCYGESINKKAFQRLYELGFKLALDDVGMGNNSIGNLNIVVPYLSRLKVSYQSLKKNLTENEVILQINLINALAKRHKLELVMEGVETQDLSNRLLLRGIAIQQGFLFSLKSLRIEDQNPKNKRNVHYNNDDFFEFL